MKKFTVKLDCPKCGHDEAGSFYISWKRDEMMCSDTEKPEGECIERSCCRCHYRTYQLPLSMDESLEKEKESKTVEVWPLVLEISEK